jgi:hypothetical protein
MVNKPNVVPPSVPVVRGVNPVRVKMEHAFHARKDSIVMQAMSLLHRVDNVMLGNTWVMAVPSLVWIATREHMKTILGPPSVNRVK